MGGSAEDMILKALGGAGALSIFAWLSTVVLKWIAEKDRIFAGAIEKFGERLDSFSNKLETAIDRLGQTVVEVDKGHTQNILDMSRQFVGLNEKQNTAVLAFGGKVDHLDERVTQLGHAVEDMGRVLEEVRRALPAPPR